MNGGVQSLLIYKGGSSYNTQVSYIWALISPTGNINMWKLYNSVHMPLPNTRLLPICKQAAVSIPCGICDMFVPCLTISWWRIVSIKLILQSFFNWRMTRRLFWNIHSLILTGNGRRCLEQVCKLLVRDGLIEKGRRVAKGEKDRPTASTRYGTG